MGRYCFPGTVYFLTRTLKSANPAKGLIVGSLFFQLPKSAAGAFPRGGVIFFVLLFNALLALAEMTAAFSSKPILLKHKSFSFYRPAAYAIAQTVVDVPLVAIQVFLFNVIIYWMGGVSDHRYTCLSSTDICYSLLHRPHSSSSRVSSFGQ